MTGFDEGVDVFVQVVGVGGLSLKVLGLKDGVEGGDNVTVYLACIS